MAQILDIQTVDDRIVLLTDVNQNNSGVTDAPIGSVAMCVDGSGAFTKIGSGLTSWSNPLIDILKNIKYLKKL